MLRELERLTDREAELVLRAPLLVCILIAGADGTIDRKEMREAVRLAEKKNLKTKTLASYFRDLSQDFEDKLRILIQSYPYESTQRQPLISSELSELNRIWPKLDAVFAGELYSLLLDMAAAIAASSGGLLGVRSVNRDEARLVNLPMIQKPGM